MYRVVLLCTESPWGGITMRVRRGGVGVQEVCDFLKLLDFYDFFGFCYPMGRGGSLTAMFGDTRSKPRQGWPCGARGNIFQNSCL